jgi:hypothetical protein
MVKAYHRKWEKSISTKNFFVKEKNSEGRERAYCTRGNGKICKIQGKNVKTHRRFSTVGRKNWKECVKSDFYA